MPLPIENADAKIENAAANIEISGSIGYQIFSRYAYHRSENNVPLCGIEQQLVINNG